MSLFTVEVDGLPVATMQTGSQGVAEEFFRGEVFAVDLACYEIKTRPGQPIGGNGTPDLHVRRAFSEEEAEWERNYAKAVLDGDGDVNDDDKENWVAFLAPIRELDP